MSVYSIRPHHLLCLGFFEGKGYDERFTVHLEEVLAALRGGALLRLTAGSDDVCAACPHCVDGRCVPGDDAARYDREVLARTGLETGRVCGWDEARAAVETAVLRPGKLREICGGCRWFSVCAAKAPDGREPKQT